MAGIGSGIQNSLGHRTLRHVLGDSGYRQMSRVADPGNLFGGATPPPPRPDPVVPMPDEEALAAAKRRSIAQQRARGGRANTILSDGNSETLG
ncbi:hypothetical protein [Solimonas soli]|uniref:hypothetical protein n=1 Tax=Solimonas soli TaxID=413479 RepID=UPI0012F880EE|nr:hypothetical protein [Solimonas soli]